MSERSVAAPLTVLALVAPVHWTTLGVGWWDLGPLTVAWLTTISGIVVIGQVWRMSEMAIGSLTRPAWPLVAIPLVSLLLAPVSADPIAAVGSAAPAVATACAVLAATSSLGMERSARALLTGLAVHLLLSLPVELWGPPTDLSLFHAQDLGPTGLGRYRGVFENPNEMGQASLVGLGLLALLGPTRRRPWVVAAAGFCGMALVASQSRTSLIALAVASVVLLILTRPHLRRAVAAVALAGLAATSLVFVSGVAQEFLGSRDNGAPTLSFSGRTAIWGAALDAIVEEPIIGVGFGNAPAVFQEARRTGSIDNPTAHAHNLVLQVGLLTGAVGVALLAVGTWQVGRRLSLADPELTSLAVGLAVVASTETLFLESPRWFDLGAWFIVASIVVRSDGKHPDDNAGDRSVPDSREVVING